MKWDAILNIIADLFWCEEILKWRTDNARRDAVDSNMLIGKLAGKTSRKLWKGAFGHSISQGAETAARTSRRT